MSKAGGGGKGLGKEYLYIRQAVVRFGFKKILFQTESVGSQTEKGPKS